jgi:lipopolysaccharide export system permease protein
VRILSRYFLTSYLKWFAVILCSSIVAIAVIEIMLQFDSALEHRNGLMEFATNLLVRVPAYYFRDLIPVACFAAAFCSIGLPARAHEITAIKSGGISPPQTAIPLLCAAAVLSGFTLLLNESVVLQASRAWSRDQNPAGGASFLQGSFWYQRGNAIYSVQEANREDRALHGVSVYELSPRGRLAQILHAERVEVEDDQHWRFFDATSRTFDPGHPAMPPRIELVSESNRDVSAESDLVMLEASARTLSLPKLAAYVDAQARSGRNATRYLALYHTRLSGPLTVFLFALLAVPLGLAVGTSRSLAAAALSGIITLAAYYTARTAFEILAGKDFAWAVAGPWVILAAFGGYGMWQLRRVPR